MNRRLSAIALCIVGLTCGACGTRAPDPEEYVASDDSTASEIAERIAGYLHAVEMSDVDRAADYWTADARLIGPGVHLERSAILNGMRTVFDAGTKVDVLDRSTLEFFAHGTVAYEVAQAEEVFVSALGVPPDTMRNNMFIRWERGRDGVWRFDRVLLSPSAPASR